MLRFFKFRDDLFGPQPAKDIYTKRPGGSGWAEHCPPIRAANSFGFDLLANFDVTFRRTDDGWTIDNPVQIASDFDWSGDEESAGRPLVQDYAWFWEKGQTLPHPITNDVWAAVRDQVKVSTFLFLETDPNEVLLFTDVPWRGEPLADRPWRTIPALVEPDWYPASYPWHVVLELDRRHEAITISKGTPLARLMPLRRDTYFAAPMTVEQFDTHFARSQTWLATHGTVQTDGVVDVQKTYVKQQAKSRFVVRW